MVPRLPPTQAELEHVLDAVYPTNGHTTAPMNVRAFVDAIGAGKGEEKQEAVRDLAKEVRKIMQQTCIDGRIPSQESWEKMCKRIKLAIRQTKNQISYIRLSQTLQDAFEWGQEQFANAEFQFDEEQKEHHQPEKGDELEEEATAPVAADDTVAATTDKSEAPADAVTTAPVARPAAVEKKPLDPAVRDAFLAKVRPKNGKHYDGPFAAHAETFLKALTDTLIDAGAECHIGLKEEDRAGFERDIHAMWQRLQMIGKEISTEHVPWNSKNVLDAVMNLTASFTDERREAARSSKLKECMMDVSLKLWDSVEPAFNGVNGYVKADNPDTKPIAPNASATPREHAPTAAARTHSLDTVHPLIIQQALERKMGPFVLKRMWPTEREVHKIIDEVMEEYQHRLGGQDLRLFRSHIVNFLLANNLVPEKKWAFHNIPRGRSTAEIALPLHGRFAQERVIINCELDTVVASNFPLTFDDIDRIATRIRHEVYMHNAAWKDLPRHGNTGDLPVTVIRQWEEMTGERFDDGKKASLAMEKDSRHLTLDPRTKDVIAEICKQMINRRSWPTERETQRLLYEVELACNAGAPLMNAAEVRLHILSLFSKEHIAVERRYASPAPIKAHPGDDNVYECMWKNRVRFASEERMVRFLLGQLVAEGRKLDLHDLERITNIVQEYVWNNEPIWKSGSKEADFEMFVIRLSTHIDAQYRAASGQKSAAFVQTTQQKGVTSPSAPAASENRSDWGRSVEEARNAWLHSACDAVFTRMAMDLGNDLRLSNVQSPEGLLFVPLVHDGQLDCRAVMAMMEMAAREAFASADERTPGTLDTCRSAAEAAINLAFEREGFGTRFPSLKGWFAHASGGDATPSWPSAGYDGAMRHVLSGRDLPAVRDRLLAEEVDIVDSLMRAALSQCATEERGALVTTLRDNGKLQEWADALNMEFHANIPFRTADMLAQVAQAMLTDIAKDIDPPQESSSAVSPVREDLSAAADARSTNTAVTPAVRAAHIAPLNLRSHLTDIVENAKRAIAWAESLPRPRPGGRPNHYFWATIDDLTERIRTFIKDIDSGRWVRGGARFTLDEVTQDVRLILQLEQDGGVYLAMKSRESEPFVTFDSSLLAETIRSANDQRCNIRMSPEELSPSLERFLHIRHVLHAERRELMARLESEEHALNSQEAILRAELTELDVTIASLERESAERRAFTDGRAVEMTALPRRIAELSATCVATVSHVKAKKAALETASERVAATHQQLSSLDPDTPEYDTVIEDMRAARAAVKAAQQEWKPFDGVNMEDLSETVWKLHNTLARCENVPEVTEAPQPLTDAQAIADMLKTTEELCALQKRITEIAEQDAIAAAELEGVTQRRDAYRSTLATSTTKHTEHAAMRKRIGDIEGDIGAMDETLDQLLKDL